MAEQVHFEKDMWEEINSPSHYNNNTMETINLIKNSMKVLEYEGYLKGNIIKYVSRYRHKEKENPKKDLLKAQWYLCKLIEEMS
tara:strand:- start:1057 stop:1308 length:252 start_codon:yes stop_codon:yes gene_type:complete